jgi:hypothetical protein
MPIRGCFPANDGGWVGYCRRSKKESALCISQVSIYVLVDDNYVGRIEVYTGRIREAGLPLDLRTQIEVRRHARQENHGPPSAQVQTTSQQTR